MTKIKITNFLPVIFLLPWLTGSCAPTLTGPLELNSSLVMGRVVIDNKHSGAFLGLLPLGVVEEGIEVEVESRDGRQVFNATTGEQGYFLIPNIPPGSYYVRRVTLEGRYTGVGREKRGQEMRSLSFTPVPGKVEYIGTVIVEISERGFSTVREVRDEERARTYLLQKYGPSPWATREFVAGGPKPVPSIQMAQEKAPPKVTPGRAVPAGAKAEKPEWKTGYQWRYAWKGPRGKGTRTTEVVREEAFEGVPCYVVRAGRNEHFYTNDILGLLGTKSGGKVTVRRNAPRQILSWPLEVGKQWPNAFILENTEEKSSRNVDYRVVVAKAEEANVPAGTFETFKIEVYNSYDGNLVAEYWYSPRVKWFVKQRESLREGLLEEELLSFKVD